MNMMTVKGVKSCLGFIYRLQTTLDKSILLRLPALAWATVDISSLPLLRGLMAFWLRSQAQMGLMTLFKDFNTFA